jgi:hypothetical protein
MQLYEEDLAAWAREQARQLRAGWFDLLDIEHLAEEIEDVGRSEQRAHWPAAWRCCWRIDSSGAINPNGAA